MELIQALRTRRSVRRYQDRAIPREIIQELLELGTTAASGMNSQPWGFVLIEDRATIDQLSDQVRIDLRQLRDSEPYLNRYERWLENPQFNFFFRTSNLILIYGDSDVRFYRESCTLAASNIMLAAHAMGIGSCWIGFASHTCNAVDFKRRYGVPEQFDLVAVLTLGYKLDDNLSTMSRKEPVIFNRAASMGGEKE